MNKKNFDQIKSYSKLLVGELHKCVMHESIFDELKEVLKLAEEMECEVMNMERLQKLRSNVIPLRRMA